MNLDHTQSPIDFGDVGNGSTRHNGNSLAQYSLLYIH